MANSKLLIVGHLARDVVKTKKGEGEFWGGAGYHVAMAASMYLPAGGVILKSVAGRDFDTNILIEKGIVTDFLTIDNNLDSDKHFLDESGEKRKYSSEGNLSEEVGLLDLSSIIDEVAWIHLASSPPEQQMRWLSEIEKYGRKDIPISVDTFDTFAVESPDKVKEVFKKCSLGFLNQTEWNNLNLDDVKMKLIRKLGDQGAQIYENGTLVINENCEGETMVVDTTGAGEVVAGVYIAKKMLGVGDKEALRDAVRVATRSVENYGTDHLRN